MGVSLVIPNWNGLHLLRKGLASICKATKPLHPEIILVDDGSTDGTISFVKREFPQVRIVRQSSNRGFIEACNRGVQTAQHDIVVLLNNDIHASDDFISPALEHFKDDKVFAVSFMALKEGAGYVEGSRKKLVFKTGLPKVRNSGEPSPEEGARSTFYAVGGHCAVRRELFLRLGGFDELYHPFYWEDVDLSFRAWRSGWKVLFDPRCIVYHRENATIGSCFSSSYVDTIRTRNQILFVWRNLKGNAILAKHFSLLGLRILLSLFVLDFRFYVSLWEAVKKVDQVIKRRRTDNFERDIYETYILRQGA